MNINKYFEHPSNIILYLSSHRFFPFLSDRRFLEINYNNTFEIPIDWEYPKSFNEKLQWLKLHDRNPEYTKMVDKNEAKQYVSNLIGEKYVIPTLGVWNSFDEIDFSKLPNQFVLKCTHDSGGIVICKDKKIFDIKSAKKKIYRSLKRNYYYVGREWPYKNVRPRIIAEPYLVDESGTELKDYKIFNFGGEPKLIEIDFDRFISHKRNLYTTDWKYIYMSIKYPTDPNRIFDKPKVLEEMLNLSRKLSAGFPHLRTDFYCIGKKILFGEYTFYHGSGFEKFTPPEWDKTLGDWIILPKNSHR